MPAIGYVQRQDDGSFKGSIKTLSVNAEIQIVPNRHKTGEQPDYKVVSGGVELGGGWVRTGEVSGREYALPHTFRRLEGASILDGAQDVQDKRCGYFRNRERPDGGEDVSLQAAKDVVRMNASPLGFAARSFASLSMVYLRTTFSSRPYHVAYHAPDRRRANGYGSIDSLSVRFQRKIRNPGGLLRRATEGGLAERVEGRAVEKILYNQYNNEYVSFWCPI